MNGNSSNDNPSWRTELEALCEQAIEGQLDQAGRDRIEQIVASDPAARTFYVDYLHQHAVLSWAAGKPEMMGSPTASVNAQTEFGTASATSARTSATST